MLYKIDVKKIEMVRAERTQLNEFDWNERTLQELLFKYLDEIIQTEDLIVISQSRVFKEEPDLMAIDENGDLWIFELKAWESESENLLQALRYGQIFGQSSYHDLESIYKKFTKDQILMKAHHQRFPNKHLSDNEFNRKQHYVIITNGIDIKTRQAIIFWRNSGLDIMPWIYRLYNEMGDIYLEFNPFRKIIDNPFEDIESKYFIINTNREHIEAAEEEMLEEQKAAAYYSTKEKMMKIELGNRIFLYSSGYGIIAGGIAKSSYKIKSRGEDPDAEYYIDLSNFHECSSPISPSEIHDITTVKYRFMHTCMQITEDSGIRLWRELLHRSADNGNE